MKYLSGILKAQQKQLLLVVSLFFCITTSLHAQLQRFNLEGREYIFENGKWYVFLEKKKGDEIIPRRLIARLADKGLMENFDFQQINIDGVSLGSARFLSGFYVLMIEPDHDPFQIATALEASGRFDVLEFDAYGTWEVTPNDP